MTKWHQKLPIHIPYFAVVAFYFSMAFLGLSLAYPLFSYLPRGAGVWVPQGALLGYLFLRAARWRRPARVATRVVCAISFFSSAALSLAAAVGVTLGALIGSCFYFFRRRRRRRADDGGHLRGSTLSSGPVPGERGADITSDATLARRTRGRRADR